MVAADIKSSWAVKVFFCQGDLGDIIALLPAIRQLGGGKLILGNWRGVGSRELMTKQRFDAIAPLLQCQPYITELIHQDDPTGVTHSTVGYRETTPRRPVGEHTLVNWAGDHFGIKHVDLSPWLIRIKPSSESKGKTVFARSARYHNPAFNWRIAAQRYPNSIFIGFGHEHREFCKTCGKNVPWRWTTNLLDAAELIAGSDRLIANQSVHGWIAMAIGHPLIQEMDRRCVNSVIRRDNAQFFGGNYP